MSKLVEINNFRIKVSSHKDIFTFGNNKNFKNLNNKKIINLNNFELKIKEKIIKYSLYYTNPYVLDKKIIKNITFQKTSNYSISNLCNKVILAKPIEYEDSIFSFEIKLLELIINKKYYQEKYISIEKTFLIMWFIIYTDKNIYDKIKLFQLLRYHYNKFIIGKFNINKIIYNFKNNSNILYKKFYVCFYLLLEEFNYKYIIKWFEFNNNSQNTKNQILNCNYIKINPQSILNNFDNQISIDLIELKEMFEIPCGHNVLFIRKNKKVFYYDSDEQNLEEIYKFKYLFNNINLIFFNISSNTPIQTITDDLNCVFYCLRIYEYIILHQININYSNLKKNIKRLENQIIVNNDMYNWIIKFVFNKN
jgi:hypothetical protein